MTLGQEVSAELRSCDARPRATNNRLASVSGETVDLASEGEVVRLKGDCRMNTMRKVVKKWGWRFWIKLAAVMLVVLVGAYFVVTSSTFFKSVILPKVGNALNADVSVSDAAISPFS